ncbi:ATP-binding protein [Rudaea sp.]|uniref:ATP-binding protein n=1 Tax=Rudaea sp. TaxID=2136325 RepID=UPI00322097E8
MLTTMLDDGAMPRATTGTDRPATRPRFRSLRMRLLLALSLTILAFWAAVAGMKEVINASDESWWDHSLRGIANAILVSLPVNFDGVLANPELLANSERIVFADPAYEKNDLTFQIWVNGQNIVHSPGGPATALKPDFAGGFADQTIDGQVWRVYDVADRTGNVHVQVGNSPQQRAGTVLRGAQFVALATLLLLVLPGIGIWWVTRWSFAPIDHLRRAMAARKPFDLTPLPTNDMLVEVQPLVESFNGLLVQLDGAVQNERRFIADAAHELRTPLAVLAAQIEVVLHADDAEEKNQAVRRLAAGVERSARLSEQLLDLARLDAVKYAPECTELDLSELIVLVARDFENFARQRRQAIVLEIETTLIRANVDEIGILLRNLLDNALRYSGEGGRVAVTCRHALRNGTIRASLSIADDGPGVPAGECARIFDRFYRVGGSGAGGSGIGLSLVSRIAVMHGATIEVGAGLDGRGLGVNVWFP